MDGPSNERFYDIAVNEAKGSIDGQAQRKLVIVHFDVDHRLVVGNLDLQSAVFPITKVTQDILDVWMILRILEINWVVDVLLYDL